MGLIDDFEQQNAWQIAHNQQREAEARAVREAVDKAAVELAAYAKQRGIPKISFPNDSRQGWIVVIEPSDYYSSGKKLAVLEDGDWQVIGMVELKRSWLYKTIFHRDYADGLVGKSPSGLFELGFWTPDKVNEEMARALKGLISRSHS